MYVKERDRDRDRKGGGGGERDLNKKHSADFMVVDFFCCCFYGDKQPAINTLQLQKLRKLHFDITLNYLATLRV